MPTETIKGYKYSCTRCKNFWIGRNNNKPKKCAKCKSPYWDKPIVRKSVSEALKKIKINKE